MLPSKLDPRGNYCTTSITAVTTTTGFYSVDLAGFTISTDFVMAPATAVMEAIEVRYGGDNSSVNADR
jgi:hypothetical protein